MTDTTERRREKNRAELEARYQEHLRLGSERCPCNLCRREREARR